MNTQELRKKYIAKDFDSKDGYYSYIHIKDLDPLLAKLESLQAQIDANKAEIEKLKTAKL